MKTENTTYRVVGSFNQSEERMGFLLVKIDTTVLGREVYWYVMFPLIAHIVA